MPKLTKLKKTYRLNPITVNTISAIREKYEEHGYSISDGEIVEKAVQLLFNNMHNEILDLKSDQ